MLMHLLTRHHKLRFEPGTRSSYSNLGTLTLGQAIANAAGRTYTSLVSEEILQPLEMGRTGFAYTPDLQTRGDRLPPPGSARCGCCCPAG
jgi:CubicO group peptidase (beta-lactamase class C family)